MKSKMTTNSQVLTTTPKKKQTKQTTRTGTEPQNGDHMEGYQWGSGTGRKGEKAQRKRSINDRK